MGNLLINIYIDQDLVVKKKEKALFNLETKNSGPNTGGIWEVTVMNLL